MSAIGHVGECGCESIRDEGARGARRLAYGAGALPGVLSGV